MQKSALDSFLSHYPEPVLKTLQDCARSRGLEIYLVGGALRDLLMNVVSVELDFAVNSDAISFVKEVREKLGRGSVVVLGDEDNDTARLVLEELSLDVVGYRQGARTIEEDLVKRDFTINSLAARLEDLVQPDREVEIVDPLGGFNDLKTRVIKACPRCFDDDPLRLLRAYRFSAQLDIMIDDETRDQISRKSPLIGTVAAERINVEFDLIINSPRAYRTLKAMQESGLLRLLVPELYQGMNVEQPPYHHLDVMEHNLATLSFVERILDQPALYFPRSSHLLEGIREDSETLTTLKWAALFHDIGKPAAMKVDDLGQRRISFHKHDEQGAELALQLGERWRWSNRKSRRVAALIAMHMHPFHLNNVMRNEKKLTVRAMHKICKRAGQDLYPLFVLAMADSLAGQGPEKPAQIEEQLERLFLEVAEFYEEILIPRVSGPKLLTGNDLIDTFKLPAGPEIGRLLEAVEAAAVEGVVSTREEALAWVENELATTTKGPIEKGSGPAARG